MNLQGTPEGLKIESETMVAVLGNKLGTMDIFKNLYPQYSFLRVKQVHGATIAEQGPASLDLQKEADAHWATHTNIALCSVSADCAPVLIYHHQPRIIAAIHAGWRGVAQRIIPKTIQALLEQGCRSENLNLIIGPHIQMPSFEVHNDVRDQLLNSISHPLTDHWQDLGQGKSLVDLHALIKEQILEFDCPAENIFSEYQDTYLNPAYHSARRDKDRAGRQISWIALK